MSNFVKALMGVFSLGAISACDPGDIENREDTNLLVDRFGDSLPEMERWYPNLSDLLVHNDISLSFDKEDILDATGNIDVDIALPENTITNTFGHNLLVSEFQYKSNLTFNLCNGFLNGCYDGGSFYSRSNLDADDLTVHADEVNIFGTVSGKNTHIRAKDTLLVQKIDTTDGYFSAAGIYAVDGISANNSASFTCAATNGDIGENVILGPESPSSQIGILVVDGHIGAGTQLRNLKAVYARSVDGSVLQAKENVGNVKITADITGYNMEHCQSFFDEYLQR